RLVSCSISAFGRSGADAGKPGYDLMIQALSGLMQITGEAEGMPMKVGVAITDVITGLYTAVSALAGLVARQAGQPGRAFDLSLFDCTLASLVNVAQSSLLTGERPKRWGNAHPQIVPYEVFATADGYIALAIGADRQWQRFCRSIDRPAWAADPRFATNPARVQHREELVSMLDTVMRERTTIEWQEQLTAIDVPHAAVASVDEALGSQRAIERGMVHEVTDAAGRRFQLVGSPVHWHDQPPRTPRAPPALGEHSAEVLRDWLGYADEDIAEARGRGAMG
ncbi:MAG TPA: CaiB/BaiF CoA-transferase family protein, partial [Pirellulales bacterium]|nr:CaiB/BaiF CoA-transferase family protein [Pirellulales bacterium]